MSRPVPRRVVSLAWGRGLGHTSRLVAVHAALRDEGLDSLFFAYRSQRMLQDYGILTVTIPPHPGDRLGESESSGDDEDDLGGHVGSADRELASRLIESVLEPADVVLHDTVVTELLYRHAEKLGCRQALIHRPRRYRPDPAGWAARWAPAIGTVYVIGDTDTPRHDPEGASHVRALRVDPIMRRPIAHGSVWRDDEATTLRIVVSPGGGGGPDAEAFLDRSLEAVALLADSGLPAAVDDKRPQRPVSVVVVTGPKFGGTLTVPRGMQARLRVIGYLDALHSIYQDTDVLIVQGGYNTVQEVLHVGARAVLVPADRPLDDQVSRLSGLGARAGLAVTGIAPDPAQIAQAVSDVLAQPKPTAQPPPDGARQIAADLAARIS